MEVYDSEREQIEAIKKWWKENGKAVVTGLVLGLVALVGWQQWSAYTTSARETASIEYNLMMQALEQGDSEGARQRGLRILGEYGSTPYATLAALGLARLAVESDDLAAARAHLQLVIDTAAQEEIGHVARVRLARLMIAEQQPGQALKLLEAAEAGGFAALYDEIKGDAHAAMGNAAKARAAYERAISAYEEEGADTSFVKIKLDELGTAEVAG